MKPQPVQQVVRREGPTHSGTNLSAPEKEAGPPPECRGEGGSGLAKPAEFWRDQSPGPRAGVGTDGP